MSKQIKMILIIGLILLVVVFALLNIQSVAINFGFGMLKLPMIVMLVLWILIGALISFLISTTSAVTKKRDLKKLNQEHTQKVAELQTQIDQLQSKLKNGSASNQMSRSERLK